MIIRLYRAISQSEKDDFYIDQIFRTGKNTLEAKQFFKSRTAVSQFVERSVIQNYLPPYLYLLMINIDEECLNESNPTFMILDGFSAVNIEDVNLLSFSKSVIFVQQELL